MLMVPSVSLALAVTTKLAGDASVAPADGAVMETVGGWLLPPVVAARAVTFVNVAVDVALLLWLVTARPT